LIAISSGWKFNTVRRSGIHPRPPQSASTSGEMSRLYVVETPSPSPDLPADHRLRDVFDRSSELAGLFLRPTAGDVPRSQSAQLALVR